VRSGAERHFRLDPNDDLFGVIDLDPRRRNDKPPDLCRLPMTLPFSKPIFGEKFADRDLGRFCPLVDREDRSHGFFKVGFVRALGKNARNSYEVAGLLAQ